MKRRKKSTWEWYAVKLIFESIRSGEALPEYKDKNYSLTHKTFEETIMLVRATSFEQAYDFAEKRAVDGEFSYQNPYNESVTWKFVKALGCFIIMDELKTGAELYSRFLHVPVDKTTEEIIAHYYPETIDEVVDHNFVLRNSDFNARPNSMGNHEK